MFRKPLHFLLFLSACLLVMPKSFAHPMGNFSVNHYSKISLENDGVKVTYIIDLAEIPTYQELQQGNITATVTDPAVTVLSSRAAPNSDAGSACCLTASQWPCGFFPAR